jgi:hypothetical protein
MVFQTRRRDRRTRGAAPSRRTLADGDQHVEKRFAEARNQAQRYGHGALAGNELAGYRYAVVVSKQNVTAPADLVQDGVVCRHINVAVDPLPPSRGRPNRLDAVETLLKPRRQFRRRWPAETDRRAAIR